MSQRIRSYSFNRIVDACAMCRQPFFVGHQANVVGHGGRARLRDTRSRCCRAENRWPTGRWQSGPCRRSAARATGRPHNRPVPRGCNAPETPRRRAESSPAALRFGRGDVQMLGGDFVGQRRRFVGRSRPASSAPNCSRLCRARSPRSRWANCRSSSAAVASSSGSLQVIRILAPGACSAWAIRSAAVKSGRAVSSAITTTSLGPAIESMSTSPKTYFLASATNRLPGPTILSTARQPFDAVGQRRDGLRSADAIDFADAQFVAGGQQVGVVGAERRRRGDDGQLRTPAA